MLISFLGSGWQHMYLEKTRIAQLHFEYYKDKADLFQKLESKRDEIQCVVGDHNLNQDYISFGEAQNPGLGDYADGVDTMAFLLGL